MTIIQLQALQARRRAKAQRLAARLYSSSTSEAERRDLSMQVAIIRQQLGFDLDACMNASEEEEEES